MKKSFGYLFGGIFATVGIGFVVGGLYFYQSQQAFLATAHKAEGIVKELIFSRSGKKGGVYYPLVEFSTPDGQVHSFRSDTGTNPASYDEGERVEVRYDPKQPSQAKLTGFWSLWGLSAIFGGLGSIFTLIGLGVLWSGIRTKQRIQQLKVTGTPIELPARVEYSNLKGSRGYYIRCEWYNPNDGKMYIYDSEKMLFDPTRFLREHVRVWIDPQNPKNYHVDTSFLPTTG